MRTWIGVVAAVMTMACSGPATVDAGSPDAGSGEDAASPMPDAGPDAGPIPLCVSQLTPHELDTVVYCAATEAYIAAALEADGGVDGGSADGGCDGGTCAASARRAVLASCPVAWGLCAVSGAECYHCGAWGRDPR